jgi:hypothetical protein
MSNENLETQRNGGNRGLGVLILFPLLTPFLRVSKILCGAYDNVSMAEC